VDTVALDELHNALGTKSLVAIVLKVVVVVKEMGLGAGLLGELEGKGEESLADSVVERRRTVGTILVQGLVDNVPTSAHVLVSACKLGDMVLHDGDEGLVVKVASTNPCGKLTVPHQVVAVDLLLVCLGPVTVAVGIIESEVVTAGLNDFPLHSVLRGEARSKVSL
jgi:hypothetical protein